MRKQYSATFKAAAVQELLKEEKTISQLAIPLELEFQLRIFVLFDYL